MNNTYKGQTAGGILKTAKIVKIQAGNFGIIVKDRDGNEYHADLGERQSFGGGGVRDVLVLHNFDGVAARLTTSTKAYYKLVSLNTQASNAMQD